MNILKKNIEELTHCLGQCQKLQENFNLVEKKCVDALKTGKKIILFGNGGSAADSSHIAAEFVGRFKQNRKSLPAISLSADASIITCIGNDYGYENVFSRQLDALFNEGDIIFIYSTSGKSKNILKALEFCKRNDCFSVGFCGLGGNEFLTKSSVVFEINTKNTARVQEAYLLISHSLVEAIENKLGL